VKSRASLTAVVVAIALATAACGTAEIEVRSAAPIDDDSVLLPTTVPATTEPVFVPDDTTPDDTTVDDPAPDDTAPDDTATTGSLPGLGEVAIPEPQISATIALSDVVDLGGDKPTRDHDEFVAVAFTDIERWWAESYPQVYGGEFEPLAGGIYAGYPERADEIPGCGEPTTSYDDLQLFVAFYCNFGDFMAYDDGDGPDSLLTPLADAYGSAVLGVVLAHEFGHAIQERIGALDLNYDTIITEQQADCFAGAWTGQAYRGESPLLQLSDADVRAGLLAMLEVRDPVGVNQFSPGGHGSAFDRVGAFQVGFLEGPGRCAELLDDPLPLMPNEFQRLDDLERGGNASYDCSDDANPECVPAPKFLAEDLNNYWEVANDGNWVPFGVSATTDLSTVSCDGAEVLNPYVVLCPTDRTIVFDQPAVRELYDEFGDFILGYLYGTAAGEFEQLDTGSTLKGEPRALLNDCYAGAWVRDITPDSSGLTPRSQLDTDNDGEPDSTVSSSPGDLDEAIQMAILLGDARADANIVGTAFEKIEAFRTGVLTASCGAG